MEGKIGIVHTSGRYKRVSEPRLLQFEYLIVTVLKVFWVLKIECPMVSGFDLILERAKRIESD